MTNAPALLAVRGHLPDQDLILKTDFGAGVESRTFTVETSLTIPDGDEGDEFLATLKEKLTDQSDAGMLAIYQHVFAFASKLGFLPPKAVGAVRATGNGNAMLQAACGLIQSQDEFQS
jgi:hypothetical protein